MSDTMHVLKVEPSSSSAGMVKISCSCGWAPKREIAEKSAAWVCYIHRQAQMGRGGA